MNDSVLFRVGTGILIRTYAAFAVLARSIVRFIVIRNPGMDDYTILGALLFTIGYLLEILVTKSHRVGFPASTLTINDMLTIIQVTLAIEVTYYLIGTFHNFSVDTWEHTEVERPG